MSKLEQAEQAIASRHCLHFEGPREQMRRIPPKASAGPRKGRRRRTAAGSGTRGVSEVRFVTGLNPVGGPWETDGRAEAQSGLLWLALARRVLGFSFYFRLYICLYLFTYFFVYFYIPSFVYLCIYSLICYYHYYFTF